jgi:transcriptional regulator of acetoin/glycerol metabolism
VVIPDRISGEDLVRNINSATEERTESAAVSRDVLISQGAPALADILMKACLAMLKQYSWPGNVREPISKMRRAVARADDRPLNIDDFNLNGPVACSPARGETMGRLSDARARAERGAVEAALEKSRFNVTRAARELGVSRVTMYKLMGRYDIRR